MQWKNNESVLFFVKSQKYSIIIVHLRAAHKLRDAIRGGVERGRKRFDKKIKVLWRRERAWGGGGSLKLPQTALHNM